VNVVDEITGWRGWEAKLILPRKADRRCIHSVKAAVNAWSETLATEVAPYGVRVNTVTPGNVVTLGADVVRSDFIKAFGITPLDDYRNSHCGRIGAPQDIAELVGFLISDRTAWITGSNRRGICRRGKPSTGPHSASEREAPAPSHLWK
jgi:NAD(P)-dependent dehydrogenase (short-subunit alcohol dehydrogenase family)